MSLVTLNPLSLAHAFSVNIDACCSSIQTDSPAAMSTALVVPEHCPHWVDLTDRVGVAGRFYRTALSGQPTAARPPQTGIPVLSRSKLLRAGAAAMIGFGWGRELLYDTAARQNYEQDLKLSLLCKPFPALKKALDKTGWTFEQKIDLLHMIERTFANQPYELKDMMQAIPPIIKALGRLNLPKEQEGKLLFMICETTCLSYGLYNIKEMPQLITTIAKFDVDEKQKLEFVIFSITNLMRNLFFLKSFLSAVKAVKSLDATDAQRVDFLMRIGKFYVLPAYNSLEMAIEALRPLDVSAVRKINYLIELAGFAQEQVAYQFESLEKIFIPSIVSGLSRDELDDLLTAHFVLVTYNKVTDSHWKILLAIKQCAGDHVNAAYKALYKAVPQVIIIPYTSFGFLNVLYEIAIQAKSGAARAYEQLPRVVKLLSETYRWETYEIEDLLVKITRTMGRKTAGALIMLPSVLQAITAYNTRSVDNEKIIQAIVRTVDEIE